MAAGSTPSALVVEAGRGVLLRIRGQHYALNQSEVRSLLDLPDVGITIDRQRLHFEFAVDKKGRKISSAHLYRRLSKRTVSKA